MSDRPAYNADGTVDYSRYTEEQLFRVLGRIDAEKYPLNFANLKAELAARQIPIDPMTGHPSTEESIILQNVAATSLHASNFLFT